MFYQLQYKLNGSNINSLQLFFNVCIKFYIGELRPSSSFGFVSRVFKYSKVYHLKRSSTNACTCQLFHSERRLFMAWICRNILVGVCATHSNLLSLIPRNSTTRRSYRCHFNPEDHARGKCLIHNMNISLDGKVFHIIKISWILYSSADSCNYQLILVFRLLQGFIGWLFWTGYYWGLLNNTFTVMFTWGTFVRHFQMWWPN